MIESLAAVLEQFTFTFEYKNGTSHSNADTLSRRPPDPIMVSAVDTYTFLADPDVLIQTQAAYPQLANLKLIITQYIAPEHCSSGLRKCFLKDGLLCRETRVQGVSHIGDTYSSSNSRKPQDYSTLRGS